MKRFLVPLSLLTLAACEGGFGAVSRAPDAPTQVVVSQTPGEVVTAAQAVDANSQASGSSADLAESTTPQGAAEQGNQFLGFSVTSLGDASVPGIWLETPLVTAEGPGRVVGENGRSIAVTLRPSGGERGSGSRLSLAGYQALGIPLTDLPTLTVISDA